jgi:hypothetical protein
MYLSQNYICFESKIFGIKTMEVIPFKDVTRMSKRSKKLKFAHGIEITTSSQTYYFASFVSREKALSTLTKIWREHVPKTEGDDDDDDDDDDTTQDYESDDSTLKKKDKKSKDSDLKDLKLGRSVECQPDHSEEREKGLRRFSSPLLSRVLPGSNNTPKNSSMSNLNSGSTNLDMSQDPESISPTNSSPPIAQSAPTTPLPSPPESEEEGGEYDETDGFLGQEAPMQQVLVVSFPVNVKTFFKIFFSDDSTFTQVYHAARGDKDLVVKKWSNSPQFGNIRDVMFLSPVKVPLGPSHTRLTETQRYHLTKNRLLMDTISMMLDIPYGDSFRVEGKWDISLTSPDSCKLTVNIGVHFMKKTWFKSKIETQTIKETKESFQQWAGLATAEITKYKASNPSSSLPKHPSSTSTSSSSSSSSGSLPPTNSPPPSSSTSEQNAPGSPLAATQTIPPYTPTIPLEGARGKSLEGGKFAMVSNLFSNVPTVPGFSLPSIILVLVFMYMYMRIAYLEGRVETLETILQPLLTKALQDKL